MYKEGDLVDGIYRIVGELGHGGMGSVYLAHHEHLNRRVALKVPLAEFLNQSESMERFEREAQLMARLQHEHSGVPDH